VTRFLLAALVAAACTAEMVDDPGRDALRRPEELIAALGITPGQTVADVGAGDGYLTWRLAREVGPDGHVVATDVDPRALARLSGRAPGVETRLTGARDPGLEDGRYDLILLAQVDHLLADRAEFLARLARALRPGGRIAVANRRPYLAPLVDAATRAGLTSREVGVELPAQHLVFLERP
jgi:ubiquinone/menaquinone biosynthesis C-methylase UbiE